ncbi:MAG: toxin-activating lysine-acyltransferase [Caulobacter sp.]
MSDTNQPGTQGVDLQLGAIVRTLLATPRKAFRIGALEPQVLPALEVQQAVVLRDQRGSIQGYALWAFVTDSVLRELVADPMRLLHRSEWNEGLNLVIMDFVALGGSARALARRLRMVELRGFEKVHAIRRTGQGAARLMTLKRRPSEMLGQTPTSRNAADKPSPRTAP